MEDGSLCNGNIRMIDKGNSKIAAKESAKQETTKPAVITTEPEPVAATTTTSVSDNPIVSRVQSAAAERARKTEKLAS